ncbi:protein abhd13 [Anaeramoeba flamelloides]|uniref:Protein abhd13 n=1 Tax=Anaeramoeba flamelloides TaxID=1746091 RepID=A0AAV7ZJU6_9EUKA|nr:protein abhd13 [Anaeramoeba flamelloides]
MPEDARTNVFLPDEKSIENLEFSEEWITTADKIKIHSYFFVKKKELPTIIYFHGNAGNIGHRLHHVKTLLEEYELNILLVEYRGFGKSEGKPSEKGLKQDGEAALQFLFNCDKIDDSKIIIFGRSLGGAIATHLAASHTDDERIKAVVLENTFTDITNMAIKLIKFIKYFHYLIHLKFDSINYISKIKTPILFISGQNDRLVPPEMMTQLYKKANDHKHTKIIRFKNGGHNDTFCEKGYSLKLKTWLNEVFKV